ncbi:MAG TPA: DedA family protein [Candidatus Saccharimonadales bacterium]|nr:DedA family protein [Candidatus Saccharimonadales bacterium]
MFDVNHIVQAGGLLVIAAIIFAESGMLVGFFFPGDTLLLAAGIFAATGKLSVVAVIIVASLAAIAGDNTGYHIGKSLGPRLFRKKDGILFRQHYLEQAEKFFEVYGSKTMAMAHFIPVVRTFAPVVAGASRMPHGKFSLFDAIGDIGWAILVTLLGYWFGSKIPNIDHYILPAFIAVVVLTFAPTFYHVFKDPKIRAALLRKPGHKQKTDE